MRRTLTAAALLAGGAGQERGAGASDGAAMPDPARQVRNDYGVAGWGGPCPLEADDAHRCNFTLYALPTTSLENPKGATTSLIGFLVNANAIATATLQATYDR